MRRMASLLAGLLILSTGIPSARAAEPKVYPDLDSCFEAEQKACVNTGHGWMAEQPSQGTGGDIFFPPDDPVAAQRTARSARINWSGQPEHPIIMVDMDKVEFPDAQPYLDSEVNRVRVPIRFVAEAMGAKVDWDESSRQVTITHESTIIKLTIDQQTAQVDDQTIQIDAPAKIVADRTMVPLRFISEAFGSKVDWVGEEPPVPGEVEWGHYQAWIWVPWGYWGNYNIQERINVHKWWYYRSEVKP
jgi:hypothetical protein